jgi:membrane-associated phospholipid phosphatase
MYWQSAALNLRIQSTFYLYLISFVITGIWIFFGDIVTVKHISEIPWLIHYHAIVHEINAESMIPFYLLFIGLAIWSKIKKNHALYYISVGYIITQLLGSALAVRILKIITGHARPEAFLESGGAHIDAWIGLSFDPLYNGFPSGHTADFFVSAIYLSICLPKTWMRVLVFAFAGLNGFLRVAQTKHFPLDVFGGVVLAGLSAYLVWKYWVAPRLNIELNKTTIV